MAIIGSSPGLRNKGNCQSLPKERGRRNFACSAANIDGPFRQIYLMALIFHTSLDIHWQMNDEAGVLFSTMRMNRTGNYEGKSSTLFNPQLYKAI